MGCCGSRSFSTFQLLALPLNVAVARISVALAPNFTVYLPAAVCHSDASSLKLARVYASALKGSAHVNLYGLLAGYLTGVLYGDGCLKTAVLGLYRGLAVLKCGVAQSVTERI